MTFNQPTTKAEMYERLVEIYKYYRLRKVDYEGVAFQTISLERLQHTPLNDAEIAQRARAIAYTDYQKEIADKTFEVNVKIQELTAKKTLLSQNLASELSDLDFQLEQSLKDVQEQATLRGMANSVVVSDRIQELTDKINAKKNKLTAKYNGLITQTQSQIEGYTSVLDNISEYYNTYYQSAITKRTGEVKDSQKAIAMEVFKYNNSLDEKEQRHKNAIEQVKANLDIKYAQIFATSFTKEQLVEMGYYKDVIACVTSYYNTLEPTFAYQDITGEGNLATYLEDYYANIVYMYRNRAGA